MNDLFNDNIILLEPEHKYQLKSDLDFEFKSVTELASIYFEPFNEVAIASKLVAEHRRYAGMEVQELISKWHNARDYGTKVHEQIELYLNNDSIPDTAEASVAIDWLKKYQMKSDIKIHTEVRVYSKELKLAGSIDILAYDKNTDMYEILDWKTSKSIEQTSFNGKMGRHPITSHLMDCNYIHYSMQLSFYRYLLEEYYGITVNNQLIVHLKKNECVPHVADYYKQEVINILEHQKN